MHFSTVVRPDNLCLQEPDDNIQTSTNAGQPGDKHKEQEVPQEGEDMEDEDQIQDQDGGQNQEDEDQFQNQGQDGDKNQEDEDQFQNQDLEEKNKEVQKDQELPNGVKAVVVEPRQQPSRRSEAPDPKSHKPPRPKDRRGAVVFFGRGGLWLFGSKNCIVYVFGDIVKRRDDVAPLIVLFTAR